MPARRDGRRTAPCGPRPAARAGCPTCSRACTRNRTWPSPCAQPPENLRLHRLRAGEAQIGLHAGERVGREARAFLEHDADLVVPVVRFDRAGDEAERVGLLGLERRADLLPEPLDRIAIVE